MKKFVFWVSLFLMFPYFLDAVRKEDVDYKVSDYIVQATMDISGNMKVKEVIGVKGTYNGYIRDLVYKNSKLPEFTSSLSDYKGSSIYNASSITIYKVGSVEWDGELTYQVFDKEIKESSECYNNTNCYSKSSITDGVSIKMFNETEDDITYFYIEYLVGNVVVMHEDVAELYYNFIGDNFDDDILNYKLRVILPQETKEDVRVWAHGPLNGKVGFVKSSDNETFYGGYLEVLDLERNTPLDMRIVFPKNLINVDHFFLKKSGQEALLKIVLVEEERAEEANLIREKSRKQYFVVLGSSILYIIVTVGVIIFVHIKYDRELKSRFKGKYYREFIDDYDVTSVEYLFKKNITDVSFSTSILNMIYKKNIKYKEINKSDYEFTLVSEDGLNINEKKIINIIFNQAGDGKTTSLSEIKDYSKKLDGNSSLFLNLFNNWKNGVLEESEKLNFYENNGVIKVCFGLYGLLGLVVIFLHLTINMFNYLTVIVFLLTLGYIIYIICFTKKTRKGAEHYAKWKAFKNFLEDFGNFKEKELPHIDLWERYLVYASIFGIANKVSKVMKLKVNEFSYEGSSINSSTVFTDYLLWSSLNRSIRSSVSSSINTAYSQVARQSSNSSGGGFGGGFSSGSGFGGGGGGGRGF